MNDNVENPILERLHRMDSRLGRMEKRLELQDAES